MGKQQGEERRECVTFIPKAQNYNFDNTMYICSDIGFREYFLFTPHHHMEIFFGHQYKGYKVRLNNSEVSKSISNHYIVTFNTQTQGNE